MAEKPTAQVDRSGQHSPCEECAFSDRGAGREPYNSLRAHVAALGPVPFFCHHGVDWQNQKFWVGAVLRENCRTAGICEGWRREVRRLNDAGLFKTRYQVIRRAVAEQCLGLVGRLCNEENPSRKAKLEKLMKRMVRFLNAKDVGKMKIPLLRDEDE